MSFLRSGVGLAALATLLLGGCGGERVPTEKPAPDTRTPPASYLAKWNGVWKRAPGYGFTFDPRPHDAAGAPFKPEWRVAHDADRGADCLPEGMPSFMNMVHLMELVPQPHQFTVISEYQSNPRRIYIDGRSHPEVMWGTFNGHSIGHWEGDTLIVETVSMRDDVPFNGANLSDKARVVERMRLVDDDTWEDTITVEDQQAFAQPWTVTKRFVREKAEIHEYVCQENNHNGTDADGKSVYGR